MAGATFVLALGRGVHKNWGTDKAGDVVIIAVYIGACERMAKANVGIRIRWTIDDAERLSCNEADCGCKESFSRNHKTEVTNDVSPALAPARSMGKIARRILLNDLAKLVLWLCQMEETSCADGLLQGMEIDRDG